MSATAKSPISQPTVDRVNQKKRSASAVGFLLLTDLAALSLSAFIAFALRSLFAVQLDTEPYLALLPAVLLFPAVYLMGALYPGFGLGPIEELRRIAYSTSLVFLVLAAGSFMFKGGQGLSRGLFLIAWILSISLVWLGRTLVRQALSHRSWWGFSVVIIGAGKTGRVVADLLLQRPELGLKPSIMLDDDPSRWGEYAGIPIHGGIDEAPHFAEQYGLRYAIVAMPGASRQVLLNTLETNSNVYQHVLVIPDLFGLSSLWVATRDLNGVLGLELRQRLLLPHCRQIKRTLDLVLVVIGGILISPVFLFIGLLIKLESKGPVFYGHHRLGQRGKAFKAWKFRSMVQDADQVLEDYLEKNPELRQPWEEDQKLKDDPRLTVVGRLLRRMSLDELPQVWNVLKGEMSLVGPRPIIENEVARYGSRYSLMNKVLPGMTGLWQVSGRSDVSYAQRVELDSYYVLNWSVWLDIYILVLTIKVVIKGDGAY